MRSHAHSFSGLTSQRPFRCPAARPVDERFCTLRHRTDAAGLAEHAVSAHTAGLTENASTFNLPEKQRVVRGENRNRSMGRDGLHAVAAGRQTMASAPAVAARA